MEKAVALNLLDRVGWTFVQALGAVAADGGAAESLKVAPTDWRAALIGGLVGAVLCALKVFGVHVSTASANAVEMAARLAGQIPAIQNVVAKVEQMPAGSVAAEVVRDVVKAVETPTVSAPPAPAPVPSTVAIAAPPAPSPVVPTAVVVASPAAS